MKINLTQLRELAQRATQVVSWYPHTKYDGYHPATQGKWHIGHVSETSECAAIDSEDLQPIADVMNRRDQPYICRVDPPTALALVKICRLAAMRLKFECCCPGHMDYNGKEILCDPCETLSEIESLCEGMGK